MARVPKFLADYSERRGFPARVTGREELSPSLFRITFQVPALRDRAHGPCDATAFRVAHNDFRHYTAERVESGSGTATVLFHRHPHEDAPGLRLVRELSSGDEVTWCGFGSGRTFRWPDPAPAAALAMGDTTTLGLLVNLTERAEQDGTRFLAVAEVEDDCVAATRELLPDAVVLTADERPGAAAAHWLVTEAAELLPDLAPRLVLLAGHGESVQRQRTLLREHHGLDRRLVRTQPYWATGRTGL
ncbi:SIP domain-containing protein [Streptomyces lonarensis]|uniref:SIP domain-containing protein n=1 Tax=Streptomyces lonarensis TaxID=700599 RepID=A0A7X6D2R5_9ACTN|nr:SIP domain-containing protein [Streptomyces lonarensis]NJQ07130.1 SIP domain-containing protein [Streptomyces lonarensis]